MRKLDIYSLLFLCLFATCNISCEPEKSETKNEVQDDSSNDLNHSIEIDTIDDDYVFMPPSPIQIASILNKANMKYEEGLANNISNAKLYSTKFKQSINFGVYACDLAYCVTNDKYEEASKYLKVSKDLAAKIGMESIFLSDNLVDRFEANVGNQDSIMSILFHVQMLTDDYIYDNDLTDLSVIYFTGANTIIINNAKETSPFPKWTFLNEVFPSPK